MNDTVTVGVRSQSNADIVRHVVWHRTDDHWHCDCPGFAYRRRCRHLDLVKLWCADGLVSVTIGTDAVETPTDAHHTEYSYTGA